MPRKQTKRDLEKETKWRGHINAWRESGLSQPEFCRLNNLNKHTFQYWVTHITRRDAEEERETNTRKRATPKARRSFAKAKPKAVKFVPIDVLHEDSEQIGGEDAQSAEQKNFVMELQTQKGFSLRVIIDSASLRLALSAIGMIQC